MRSCPNLICEISTVNQAKVPSGGRDLLGSTCAPLAIVSQFPGTELFAHGCENDAALV
jgi:hypothetical protein